MVQEIGGETEPPDGNQTGHHIHTQCDESVFVSTEDYILAGDNEDFEVSEESFRGRTFLFCSWTTRAIGFRDAD